MGTVYLTGSHHGLYCRSKEPNLDERIRLDPSILQWIAVTGDGDLHSPHVSSMILAALRALVSLKGFDSAISLSICDTEVHKSVQTTGRVWGELFFDEPSNVILSFSHDTRYHNYPFCHLEQWLEGEYNEANPQEWHDAERWLSFFHKRIRMQAYILETQAKDLRNEAEEHSSLADQLRLRLDWK
jgi:hypothetical protein